MRDAAGGVLDNMSNGQFRAEALACARLARMQPELSEQLAQSYGI